MGPSAGSGLLCALAGLAMTCHARAHPTRISESLLRRTLQTEVNLTRARPRAHPSAPRTRTIGTLPQRLKVVDLREAPSNLRFLKPVGGEATTEAVLPRCDSE